MTRAKYAIIAGWQAAMALTLLLDPSQYTSSSYAVLFAVSPPWFHGVVWLAAFALSLWAVEGTWASQRVALAVASGLALSWALAFLGAAVLGQLSGWSGPVTWSYVAGRLLRDLLLVPREG